jgi:hypothetical protein
VQSEGTYKPPSSASVKLKRNRLHHKMYLRFLIATFSLSLWKSISAQTTACPACDALMARWTPNANTGSCLGNLSDPVQYIVNFEQCICSPGSEADYAACAGCNVNGDGGIPIDGLNFGPAAEFKSACSLFASDVTSVLEPSGLNAFASVVAPINTASNTEHVSSRDILGLYIFQNVVTASNAVSGIMTDSVAPRTTGTASATTTRSAATIVTSGGVSATAKASGTGTRTSESQRNKMPFSGMVGILAVGVVVAVFV